VTSRKTPILLRRAPLTGEVMALYRYTRKTVRGRDVIDAGFDGKQSVTGDFDALVLTELLDPDSPDMVGILDGVADGQSLNDEERTQVRAFRERLKTMVERHNARLDGEAA
jgi:hypothetical protein